MKQLYILFIALLVGCATATTNPQRVYQAQNNYNAALTVAVAYKALPTCPVVPICKTERVVKQLQDADDVAAPALETAQKAVRSGNMDTAQAAIQAANIAIAALTAITSQLVIKEQK